MTAYSSCQIASLAGISDRRVGREMRGEAELAVLALQRPFLVDCFALTDARDLT